MISHCEKRFFAMDEDTSFQNYHLRQRKISPPFKYLPRLSLNAVLFSSTLAVRKIRLITMWKVALAYT